MGLVGTSAMDAAAPARAARKLVRDCRAFGAKASVDSVGDDNKNNRTVVSLIIVSPDMLKGDCKSDDERCMARCTSFVIHPSRRIFKNLVHCVKVGRVSRLGGNPAMNATGIFAELLPSDPCLAVLWPLRIVVPRERERESLYQSNTYAPIMSPSKVRSDSERKRVMCSVHAPETVKTWVNRRGGAPTCFAPTLARGRFLWKMKSVICLTMTLARVSCH